MILKLILIRSNKSLHLISFSERGVNPLLFARSGLENAGYTRIAFLNNLLVEQYKE